MLRKILLLCACAPAVHAATEGQLDLAFGENGRAAFGFLESATIQHRASVRSPTTGALWMFGADGDDPAAVYQARTLSNGDVDATFGPNSDGRRRIELPPGLTFQDEFLTLAGALMQSDGRPVIFGGLRALGADTGPYPGFVCRLTLAGTLDASFGTNGCRAVRSFLSTTETCTVSDVAQAPDDDLVAVANCIAGDLQDTPMITRFNPGGTLDTEFGAGAGAVLPVAPATIVAQHYTAVVVRPDDRIAVAGDATRIIDDVVDRDLAAWQFSSGGSSDATFGDDGFARIAFNQGGDNGDDSRDLALRPSGELVLLGQATVPAPRRRVALLAQLDANGQLDPAFGSGGRRVDTFADTLDQASSVNALAIDDLGRILVGGSDVTGLPDAHPNAGTEFWFSLPRGIPPEYEPRILISADVATSGVVEAPSENLAIPFSVTPGQVTVVDLPVSLASFDTNGSVTSQAVHVTALARVVVQGFTGRTFSLDGFNALPVDELGTHHRVVSWNRGLGAGSQLSVTATKAGVTTVVIVPTETLAGHDAGIPYTLQLARGQVYQAWTGADFADLTGTTVTADAPISLLAGHSCALVPNDSTDFCDAAFEQMQPVARWGREFVVAPFAGRNAGDVLRIVADESGTIVSIDGEVDVTLAAGEHATRAFAQPLRISATRPVAVAQFAKGCKADLEPECLGDPMMVEVPPVTAWSARYLAVLPGIPIGEPEYTHERYISIVAPTPGIGAIYIDNVRVTEDNFAAIGSSGYSVARLLRPAGSDLVSASQPVSVSVYGHRPSESWGYPAAAIPVSQAPSGSVATADDLIARYKPDGSNDPFFGTGGVARIDHTASYDALLPSFDGVVDLILDGSGVLVGSDSTNADSEQSFLLGYRLVAAELFRDSFED